MRWTRAPRGPRGEGSTRGSSVNWWRAAFAGDTLATVASSPRFTMLAFSCYVSGTGDESHGSGKLYDSPQSAASGLLLVAVRPDTQQHGSSHSRTRTGPLRAEMIPIKAAITHEIGRTWVSNRRRSLSLPRNLPPCHPPPPSAVTPRKPPQGRSGASTGCAGACVTTARPQFSVEFLSVGSGRS